MRLLIQRVSHADVKVDGETVGSIGKGFLVLVGVGQNDTREMPTARRTFPWQM